MPSALASLPDLSWLNSLSASDLQSILGEAESKLAYGRIEDYYPDTGPLRRALYPKHCAFFAAGLLHRIRVMMAANRVGKTEGVGLYEAVLHMTGDYPPWWVGRRFTRPVNVWLAGDTSLTVRDILQAKLFGRWDDFGKGLLPLDRIDGWTTKRGVPQSVDTFTVKHASGGLSRGVFKSYDQKRQAFQGTEQDIILLDEEPTGTDALGIVTECLLRTMTTNGLLMLTFTPLSGMTKLIKHLRGESGSWEIGATWDDVPHLSQREKDELWAAIPDYMRDARAKGLPQRGSGVVYPVSRMTIEAPHGLRIEPWWHRIGGLDFGWDHPNAAVEMCHDPDSDVLYVTKCHRMRQATPLMFAAGLKPWGDWLPWAWPHDGLRRDKDPQAGRMLAELYADQGLRMLATPASWNDETLDNSLEPALMGMLDYMQSGRFKVLPHLIEWWTEFDDYHRDNGVVVKEDDDLMSATNTAFMMRRFAIPPPRIRRDRPGPTVSWRAR